VAGTNITSIANQPIDYAAGIRVQVISGGGGAGGGGDASAANQTVGNDLLTTISNSFKAEDAPHVSGDKGLMLLAVRQDTPAALAGTNGDYIPVTVDASGRVYVNVPNMPGGIGQTSKANSLPVTLASDEDIKAILTGNNTSLGSIVTALGLQAKLTDTQPISVAALPLPTGASTAANQTTGNTSLASIVTALGLQAKLADTQPVSLASQPLPTGAATETTLVAVSNALGTSGATAWGGTGNASIDAILKGVYNLLAGDLSAKLVDSASVDIDNTNPLQVQIGQLLASQDSVQANQYGLGDAGAVTPVRYPTTHASNVASAWASNATQVLIAAPAAGNKAYIFHLRFSVDAASVTDGPFQLLDNTGGTIIERFQCLKGQTVDLWFPNGSLRGTTAQLVAIKNTTGGVVTLANWGVDYSVGP
jgi:hypothetical protein